MFKLTSYKRNKTHLSSVMQFLAYNVKMHVTTSYANLFEKISNQTFIYARKVLIFFFDLHIIKTSIILKICIYLCAKHCDKSLNYRNNILM